MVRLCPRLISAPPVRRRVSLCGYGFPSGRSSSYCTRSPFALGIRYARSMARPLAAGTLGLLIALAASVHGPPGRLDPEIGPVSHVPLGARSWAHGVIVTVSSLPAGTGNANLNTATLDGDGALWLTGQAGIYGGLVADMEIKLFSAPRSRGPDGLATTPDSGVYLVSLAGATSGRLTSPAARSECWSRRRFRPAVNPHPQGIFAITPTSVGNRLPGRTSPCAVCG